MSNLIKPFPNKPHPHPTSHPLSSHHLPTHQQHHQSYTILIVPAQHEDCSDILTSLQPFVSAYNFIPSTIRERNRKFQQYPLLYNLSHTYLTWISGFQAYFGGRLMESANTLMNTTTSATAILQHLAAHYPAAVPFVTGGGDGVGMDGEEVLAKVDTAEYLPSWLTYKRCHTFLLKAQLDSLMTIIKFAPVLPHNAVKAKLLTAIVGNDIFQTQKKDIDEYFFPGASTRVVYFGTQQRNNQGGEGNGGSGGSAMAKSPFDAFPSLITNTVLMTRADRELAKSEVVLWSECMEKLIKNGVLSRFELNYIAAINKTPVPTLQELNSRSEAQGQSGGADDSRMGDEDGLGDGQSPFSHPTLSPLLQHNLLTVTAYTTSISFPQLCIVLGLDPKGKRVVDGLREMVRGMILANILPQGWSKIDDAVATTGDNDNDGVVSVLNLNNAVVGTLGRVEATMESRSLFLRHVYDAAIDGEKYNRQWQQQGNGGKA